MFFLILRDSLETNRALAWQEQTRKSYFFRWFTCTVRRLGFINTSPTYQFTKYGILNREWDGLYYALLDSMNEKALWEHVRVNDLAVKLAIIASNSTLNFYLSKCEHNFPLWTINTSSQSSIYRNHCCSLTGNFVDFNNFPWENRLEMCS